MEWHNHEQEQVVPRCSTEKIEVEDVVVDEGGDVACSLVEDVEDVPVNPARKRHQRRTVSTVETSTSATDIASSTEDTSSSCTSTTPNEDFSAIDEGDKKVSEAEDEQGKTTLKQEDEDRTRDSSTWSRDEKNEEEQRDTGEKNEEEQRGHAMNQKNQEEDDDAPEDLCCPITMELFRDPVVIASGNTYERSAIERVFGSGNFKDPLTNALLPSALIVTNWDKRKQVQLYLESRGSDFVPSGWASRDVGAPAHPGVSVVVNERSYPLNSTNNSAADLSSTSNRTSNGGGRGSVGDVTVFLLYTTCVILFGVSLQSLFSITLVVRQPFPSTSRQQSDKAFLARFLGHDQNVPGSSATFYDVQNDHDDGVDVDNLQELRHDAGEYNFYIAGRPRRGGSSRSTHDDDVDIVDHNYYHIEKAVEMILSLQYEPKQLDKTASGASSKTPSLSGSSGNVDQLVEDLLSNPSHPLLGHPIHRVMHMLHNAGEGEGHTKEVEGRLLEEKVHNLNFALSYLIQLPQDVFSAFLFGTESNAQQACSREQERDDGALELVEGASSSSWEEKDHAGVSGENDVAGRENDVHETKQLVGGASRTRRTSLLSKTSSSKITFSGRAGPANITSGNFTSKSLSSTIGHRSSRVNDATPISAAVQEPSSRPFEQSLSPFEQSLADSGELYFSIPISHMARAFFMRRSPFAAEEPVSTRGSSCPKRFCGDMFKNDTQAKSEGRDIKDERTGYKLVPAAAREGWGVVAPRGSPSAATVSGRKDIFKTPGGREPAQVEKSSLHCKTAAREMMLAPGHHGGFADSYWRIVESVIFSEVGREMLQPVAVDACRDSPRRGLTAATCAHLLQVGDDNPIMHAGAAVAVSATGDVVEQQVATRKTARVSGDFLRLLGSSLVLLHRGQMSRRATLLHCLSPKVGNFLTTVSVLLDEKSQTSEQHEERGRATLVTLFNKVLSTRSVQCGPLCGSCTSGMPK
ncbi:unnamed protein product [Amoebophrya sp. A25]|nr:unnamed protein product [Amoebophrya sp. A25]|eukprot:GSA25T00006318001.1